MTTPSARRLPLLETKLHPPRRRRALVARPRLHALVARHEDAALTLVSAPAGFGKTTFVVDLVADHPSTAWLSLDPGDDEPARFWTHVVAALDAVAPDLATTAASLVDAPQPSTDAVVAALLNDLAGAQDEVVVVLDDYHSIESSSIHDSVAFLVRHLPSQVRVVIVTRADPPLPLASMRARGELLEVRAADLRFTADEASSYLNDAMGLTLAPTQIDVLESRTEGWIAALQLAALSIRGRADPSGFIDEFAGDDRFILDYLADEVLERQSDQVRDFLLDTSVLGRLTGPLCAAVTGQADARSTLEELDRSNLFVVALDDRRTWYRYHHLFGDVLRARLLEAHPERLPVLHRRASDWYAANGDAQTAIVHAMEGDDPAHAAALIEGVAAAMSRARQEATLRSWLEALPVELFADRPVLTIALVGTRMSTGDPTGVEPLLESVESWLERDATPIVVDQQEYARLPALLAMYRAALALLAGDTDETILQARRVLDLALDSDLLQRGAGAALLGLAHWSRGDLDTARACYVDSIACFEQGDYLADALGCSVALTDIQITQGRLHDATRTFESGLRHTTRHPGLRGAADMHIGLCGIAIEHDDLDAAARHLDTSAALGEHLGLPQHAYRWRVAAARLLHARGDLVGALEMLDEAAPLYNTDFSPSVRPIDAMAARLHIERGDLAAARHWADSRQLSWDDDLRYVSEYEHVTLARLLVAQAMAGPEEPSLEQAIALLGGLLTAADDGHRTGTSIEVLALLSVAHHLAGDHTFATDTLGDALARAEHEGHVRTFLDAGTPITEVLSSLRGDAGGRAARLLGADASGASGAPAAPAAPVERPRSGGPDELSDRELDVLRLLRSDLRGPEIARALHISLNTFRTHTQHIYTKLGATNRREAVSRAAELGL